MKVLVQRVKSACVEVEGKRIAEIGAGLLLLTAIGKGDNQGKLLPMAEKVANLRIFPNEEGRFDLSLLDTKGQALVVPQFTLYADTKKGRRPEFFGAMEPEEARGLTAEFSKALERVGVGKVSSGEFGAYMQVSLVNDGPVTIMLEN